MRRRRDQYRDVSCLGLVTELDQSGTGHPPEPNRSGRVHTMAVSDWLVTIFPGLPLADYNYKAGPHHPPPPSETQSGTGCCEFSDQVYLFQGATDKNLSDILERKESVDKRSW